MVYVLNKVWFGCILYSKNIVIVKCMRSEIYFNLVVDLMCFSYNLYIVNIRSREIIVLKRIVNKRVR